MPGNASAGAFGGTQAGGAVSDIPLPGGWAAWGGYNIGLVETVPSVPPTSPGSNISGLAWNDQNNDGVRGPFEPNYHLFGMTVTVRLTGTDNTGQPVNKSTEVDARGFYQFTGLKPGTYTLKVLPPPPHSDSLAGPSVGAFGGTVSLNTISNIIVPDWKESGGYNFPLVYTYS